MEFNFFLNTKDTKLWIKDTKVSNYKVLPARETI